MESLLNQIWWFVFLIFLINIFVLVGMVAVFISTILMSNICIRIFEQQEDKAYGQIFKNNDRSTK